MQIVADRPTGVNRRNNFNDWITGFNLYADGKPLARCANNAQRRGWLDAQAGERACALIDAVLDAGGTAERADHVLAKGW